MAAGVYKLTWYFWWATTAGWSENYYLLAGSRDLALQRAADLRAARCKLLINSPGVLLALQRLAETDPPFRLTLERVNLPGVWLFPQTQVGPWDGWQVTYRAAAGGWRSAAVRGAPRPASHVLDPTTEAGTWFGAWEQWVAALGGASACLQVSAKARRYPVLALRPDAAFAHRVLATSPNHGFPIGSVQLVSFARLRARPTITWQYLVDVIDAQTVVLRGTNLGRVSYPGGGYFTVVEYQYQQITDAQIMRYGLKRIHRNFVLGSWTTVDPAASIGMHPCGLVMDVISNGYTIPMRMGIGQSPLPVRWFMPPDGTPIIPGWHAFGSQLWDGNWKFELDRGNIGEVGQNPRPWASRKPNAAWGYRHTAGPDDYFVNGSGLVFLPLVRSLTGVPAQCNRVGDGVFAMPATSSLAWVAGARYSMPATSSLAWVAGARYSMPAASSLAWVAGARYSMPGTSVASFAGLAATRASFAMPGDSSLVWAGASEALASYTMPGTSSLAWAGASETLASFAMPGDSDASWSGLEVEGAAFAMPGDSDASFSGLEVEGAAFAMPGDSDASWSGLEVEGAAFAMPGDSSLGWAGATETLASYTMPGDSTFAAVSAALSAASFAMPGDSALAAASAAVKLASFAMPGDSALAAASAAVKLASFAMPGDSALAWVAGARFAMPGDSSASFVGTTAPTGPTFRASSSGDLGSVAGGGTVTITLPTGTVSTDLVIVVMATDDNFNINPPAGWTTLGTRSASGGGNNETLGLYCAAGNVAALGFQDGNLGGTWKYGWVAAAFSGCATSGQPLVSASGADTSGSATVTMPTLATSDTTCFEAIAAVARNAGTWTATGFNVIQNAGVHQDATLIYNVAVAGSGFSVPSVVCSNSASTAGQLEAVVGCLIKFP